MEEVFKDIKDYEGLYQISNLGRVKSLNYKRTGKERVLTPIRDSSGYFMVCLCKDGIKKQFLVHRLVAEAFIPNTDGKPEVDHIVPVSEGGGNEVFNLRWCTRVENNNNPLTKEKLSEAKKGENNPMYGKSGAECPNSKPVIGVNKLTGEEVWFTCAMEAERVLGITQENICFCLKGKRKSAGGFYWRYA